MAIATRPDGIEVGFEELGSGDPVVLLGGTAVDHTIFLPGEQLPTIAGSFRALGVDYRGTGASTRPDTGYDGDDLAADVIHVLDHLGIDRAALVGLSMGSTVAVRVAGKHPERVSGLALLNPWAHTDEYLRRQFTIWRYLYETADPVFFGQATLYWLLSREFINANPAMVDGIAQDVFAGPNAPSRDDYLRHVDVDLAVDVRGLLPAIACPTLVVAGERDRCVPPVYAEQVAEAVSGARLEVLTGPGSSHGLFLERAADVNTLIVEFLKVI